MTREQEFLAHLPAIEKVIAWVCARRGLRGADAEDFASEVKARLVENDYEVLARHEGRSALTTYLAVVVNRLCLDYLVRRFGRWRPSAEARRLGPLAERLERLVHRDGLTVDEACGVLGSDPSVPEDVGALRALYERLPPRARRGVPGDGAEPAAADADPAERRERQELADRVFAVLRRALAALAPSDRLLLRLHVESGFTLAQAARTLGIEQKAAYRRKDEVLRRLREALAGEGLGAADAHELLSRLDWDAALGGDGTEPGREASGERPSNGMDATPTTEEG
ncbi:MAG: sigma-70 family RNA polymerase sigma factor [Vicinamibacteria bacterium]